MHPFPLQKATGNDASENAAGFSNLLLLALATFSTAYNVILYVIFNPSFKQAIIGVLRCRSVREVNDRVSVEPSQSPLSQQNQGGGETGNTFTITDASSSFDNVLSKVEMSSVSGIQ